MKNGLDVVDVDPADLGHHPHRPKTGSRRNPANLQHTMVMMAKQ